VSEEQSIESGAMGSVESTVVSPWASLRAAREARGLSVMDAAQHLKLTPRQVEAMESGDMAQLPEPAFARGFVRNYARYLHLDPALFAGLIEPAKEDPVQLNAVPLGSMPGPGGWKFSALPALGVAAVLLSLAVAGWHFSWFEQRDEQYVAEWMEQSAAMMAAASAPSGELLQANAEVLVAAGSEPIETSAPAVASAPVEASAPAAQAQSVPQPVPVVVAPAPASAPVATRPAAASSVASAAASSAAPVAKSPVAVKADKAQSAPKAASEPVEAGKLRALRFSFKAESWVEVRDGKGNIIFSRVNPAGSVQEVKGQPPLEMVVGNAAQVELSQDGKPVPLTVAPNSSVARVRLP
jgi:cytoskeleton protein RodZ